jgi:hypothetical protein
LAFLVGTNSIEKPIISSCTARTCRIIASSLLL